MADEKTVTDLDTNAARVNERSEMGMDTSNCFELMHSLGNASSPLRKTFEIDSGRNEWWKSTVVYEVYVRSFYDSNSDGIGDLPGIESKLDYFLDLGVETLWLTPIYVSPMVDFGYDISNFMDIDPVFGTLDDFKSLVCSMKKKGLKLILDFVPNHTSDHHEWFQRSIKRQKPYSDYYVWKSPKGFDETGKPIVPNNWISVFGGSAWQYHPERGEFYLHQFTIEQPDLNYRNPLVLKEMIHVMEFWLDLGVDGFRLDAAPHLLEDEEFRDETPAPVRVVKPSTEVINTPDEYSYWDHSFTCNVPGVLDLLHSFRKVCEMYSEKSTDIGKFSTSKVLMIEGYLSLSQLIEYYGTPSRPIGHFPFNFELIGNLKFGFNGFDVYTLVTMWFQSMPKGAWANWVVGNHDQGRVATRFGKAVVDALNMIILLLPGTAISYYGEELGMENTEISWENTVDPAGLNAGPTKYMLHSRDPARSPMQWSNEKNAGFSKGIKSWLPCHPNCSVLNVEFQKSGCESHLRVYKQLVAARQMASTCTKGSVELQCLNDKSVFAFTRIASDGSVGILVVTNFGTTSVVVDVTSFANISTQLTVFARSISSEVGHSVTSILDASSIQLGPKDGIVLMFHPALPK